MLESMPILELPADNFGVHVENDMDRRRLLWLANQIGEEKLLKSVDKYRARHHGDKPYVTRLLKWHRLRVPPSVYLSVSRAVHCVYFLVLSNHSAFKIGYTGDFARRALQFLPTKYEVDRIFDVDLSFALEFNDEALARRYEGHCKTLTRKKFCKPPYVRCWGEYGVAWGAGGRTEWREFEVLELLRSMLRTESGVQRTTSLRDALNALQKAADVGFDRLKRDAGEVCH